MHSTTKYLGGEAAAQPCGTRPSSHRPRALPPAGHTDVLSGFLAFKVPVPPPTAAEAAAATDGLGGSSSGEPGPAAAKPATLSASQAALAEAARTVQVRAPLVSPPHLHAATWGPLILCSQRLGGAVASPFDCYLVLRGIRSLFPRMRMHCENALQVRTTGSASDVHPLTPSPPSRSWPARSRATPRPSQCSTRASRRTPATPQPPARWRAAGGRPSSAACCPCASSGARRAPWHSRTRCASSRARRASAAPSRLWSTGAPSRASCRRRRQT